MRTALPLLLASIPVPHPAWAQGSCGSCPSTGACPPIEPINPFTNHSCENHSFHTHASEVIPFVDFSRANLFASDFSFADAMGGDFSGADARCADFFNAELSGSDWIGADCTDASFLLADICSANLTGANLTGAGLGGAEIQFADLRDAVLVDADLTAAPCQNSTFAGADLTRAVLMTANLRNCILRGATLADAQMSFTDVSDADFSDADLSGVTDLATTFGTASYNPCTQFPFNFDPVAAGWTLVPSPCPGIGTSYCSPAAQNSTGRPGSITATGSPVAAQNDLTLAAFDLPPSQFGYFLTSQTEGQNGVPGSSGFICLAGNIGRFSTPPQIIQGPAGSIQIDLASMPVNPPQAALPGETWNFQCWYRDSNPGPTSNFTDAVSVTLL
ncbi:MAG: pentapeptide repeat-containing protein [bacterium]|nr:pentapeptide repeat-containing protein [bacterium]